VVFTDTTRPPPTHARLVQSMSVRAPDHPSPSFFHPSIYLHTLRAQLRFSSCLFHLASTSGPFGFDWDFFSVGSLVVSSSLHPTSPGSLPYALQFFTASFVIVLHNHEHRHTSRNLNTIFNQKNRVNFTRDRRIDGPNVPSAYKPI